jgi:hypothetical protein
MCQLLAPLCRTESTKGGVNHARRLTEIGHIRALLSNGATVPQIRALHTFTKAILSTLQRNCQRSGT